MHWSAVAFNTDKMVCEACDSGQNTEIISLLHERFQNKRQNTKN